MSVQEHNVRRQVSAAAVWTYGGALADRAVRFAVFVIVARLIASAQFGVVVLSLLTVEALQAVLDFGLASALVQKAAVTDDELNTTFTVTMAVSAATSVMLFVAAPSLTAILHAPSAAAVIRGLALAPIISGLGAVHLALVQRNLGFKALAARTVVSSMIASIAAIALAFIGFGAWALVIRTIILAFCGTGAAWLAAPYRPRLQFNLHAVRAIAPSGLRLWATGVTGQINGRGYDFLAGVFIGVTALAALRIAGQTVLLMVDLTVGPMMAVGYALLSRARDDISLFRETFNTLARVSALLIFPVFTGLFVVADPLLPLVFGERWSLAASVTPYMCAVAPALYWQSLVMVGLFAAGRSDRMLHLAIIEVVLTISLGLIGARFGIVGLAAAGVSRLYLVAPLGWRWLKVDVDVDPGALLRAALPALGASLVMALVVLAVKGVVGDLKPWAATLMMIGSGVAAYGVLLPISARPLLKAMFKSEKMSRNGRRVFAK